MTYSILFLLFLGLGCFVGSGSSSSIVRLEITVCLGLSDFSGHGLGTTPARTSLGPFLLLLLVLLFGWLGNLDDDLAAIEFLAVERFDCLLRSLCAGHGDKAIACGTDTAQDELY